MKRDYRDYLQDILTATDDLAEFTRDVVFGAFVQDRKTINDVQSGSARRSRQAHLR
jgi:uncharacterized protein with HEPN domain